MQDIKISFNSIYLHVSNNNDAADYYMVDSGNQNPDGMLISDNKGKVYYRYFVILESWVSFPTPMPVSKPNEYLPLDEGNLALIQMLYPTEAK